MKAFEDEREMNALFPTSPSMLPRLVSRFITVFFGGELVGPRNPSGFGDMTIRWTPALAAEDIMGRQAWDPLTDAPLIEIVGQGPRKSLTAIDFNGIVSTILHGMVHAWLRMY